MCIRDRPNSNISNIQHLENDLTGLVKSKRDAYSIELRKQRTNEILDAKRFKLNSTKNKDFNPLKGLDPQQIVAYFVQIRDKLIVDLQTNNFLAVENTVKELRTIISEDSEGPFKECVAADLVPVLISLLNPGYEAFFDIQYEAAWCLSNIASGDTTHILYLIREGMLNTFVSLLNHQNTAMLEQVIWGLSNLTGDVHDIRMKVLECGIVPQLIRILKNEKTPNLLRVCSWMISNLVRGKPYPPYEKVAELIPFVVSMLGSDDDDTVSEATWALSFLADGPDSQIEEILSFDGVVERICELMHHQSHDINVPALRTCANCLTSEDESVIEEYLRHDALSGLSSFLNHIKKPLRREACWALSNILVGTFEHVDAVFRTEIPKRLYQMMQLEEFNIKREATLCFTNATCNGGFIHMQAMSDLGVFDALVYMLDTNLDSKLLYSVLDAVDSFFAYGEQIMTDLDAMNPYVKKFEDLGGSKALEHLQDHDESDIYDKTYEIIEKYFIHELSLIHI
eukprot:TRINITY_DN13835_c0_g1_i4.p1 TRINITY_DN13835_c0_g1~~TRINITY_DN13835_c0_g1_i4.p1  ORF type:complete len:531 (-),score=92.78 TRINITY_DN13835_c0_g1_i4:61-1593(-)